MTAREGATVDDLFWGLHPDISTVVLGLWLMFPSGTAELTADARGAISLTVHTPDDHFTEKVVNGGAVVPPEPNAGPYSDDVPFALAGRADDDAVAAAGGDEVAAVATTHSLFLEVLTSLVAAGLRTSWSVDPASGATSLIARRDGADWTRALWRNDPSEGWSFDGDSTWVKTGDQQRYLDGYQLILEALTWAPEWTLTTPLPDASHRTAPPRPVRPHPAGTPPTAADIRERRRLLADWGPANGFLLYVENPTPRSIGAALGRVRAGIYLIEFADGACYIGKAKDIVNRFRDHARKYNDIVSIRLRQEPRSLAAENPDAFLFAVEDAMIDQAQLDGLTARNKSGMAVVLSADQQFDKLISFTKQEDWRADRLALNRVDLDGERCSGVDTLRAGAAHNYERFTSSLSLHDQNLVIDIVSAFIARCVPLPLQTEVGHWTLSCMPATVRGDKDERFDTIACLSVGATEVLTIVRSRTTRQISGFVHVYEPDLTDGSDVEWIGLLRRNRGARLQASQYRDSGPEASLVHADDLPTLMHLVDDTAVTRAAAALCLNLMRVRASASTRKQSHNPEFARVCLSRAPRFCGAAEL